MAKNKQVQDNSVYIRATIIAILSSAVGMTLLVACVALVISLSSFETINSQQAQSPILKSDKAMMVRENGSMMKEESDMVTFSDNELKLSFSYPAKWGAVVYKIQESFYVDGIKPDMVTLGFSNLGKDRVFLSATKLNLGEREPGSGTWYTTVQDIPFDGGLLAYCQKPRVCEFVTNKNGLSMANQSFVPFGGEDSTETVQHYLFNASAVYQGVVVSSADLERSSLFDEADYLSVLDSLTSL